METRYQLLKYKTPADRLTCPACGKHHSLAPYVDNQTGQIIDESCGKCNRADSCAYHLPPREFFAQHPDRKPEPSHHAKPQPAEPEKRLMYLPLDTIAPCLAPRFRGKNNFWLHLAARFGQAGADAAFDAYRLGTSNHYGGGACVFPLLDGKGYASAQIIKVDAATGKTVRFGDGRATTWLHSVLKWKNDYSEHAEKFPFCFGLHLALADPQKTVCLVESAKTAVVCSIEYIESPGFVWLAVGALSYLKADRLQALKGRTILLIPDGGKGLDAWAAKVPLLKSHGFNVKTVDLGLPEGDDVADLVFDTADPAVATQPEPETVSLHTAEPTRAHWLRREAAEVAASADGRPSAETFTRLAFTPGTWADLEIERIALASGFTFAGLAGCFTYLQRADIDGRTCYWYRLPEFVALPETQAGICETPQFTHPNTLPTLKL